MLPKELLKQYKVLQLLHRGIGGEVWLAEHIALAGKRVLKFIEKSHPQYEVLSKEARLLQQCQNPSIPIIYDILEYDTTICLIEEFIEGETLKQYILRQRCLSDSQLLDFSIQLCNILTFLHNPTRSVLHLDLKPENILLSGHRLRLIDFGSAICKNQQNEVRFILGTPEYCAPEMTTGGTLAERTDIYCLGRCMEYMLFYTPKVKKGYRAIVERCLRQRETQYASVEEIKKDLEKLKGKRRIEWGREFWYATVGVASDYESGLCAGMLANYLRRHERKPVLYLDCGSLPTEEQDDLRKKKEKEETSDFVSERNGITVLRGVAPEELKSWRGKGYAYIVCSLGRYDPLLTECPFRLCLYTGVFTEDTEGLWKKAVSKDGSRRTAAVLTGGDIMSARKQLGEFCAVCSLNPFSGFGQRIKNGRVFRTLLKKT